MVLFSTLMGRLWLTLALSISVAGCFGSHGSGGEPPPGPGPGPGPMPGECSDRRPAFVTGLDCLSPATSDAVARVRVEHSVGVCCDIATARVDAQPGADGNWSIDVEYSVCDCCDECRCAAPPEESWVDLGVFPPGTAFEVEADGVRCTIEIPIISACGPMDANETLVPRVVFTDQSLATTLTMDRPGGCGCTAAASIERFAGSIELGGQLCDCCDVCDCIDPGYQASAVVDAPPPGDYELVIPHGVGTLSVRDPAACHALTPTGLRVVGPREDVSHFGPRLWWAEVRSEESLCCAAPLAGVREAAVGALGRHLEILSCVSEDCECVPPGPTPVTAWFPLGELSPGTHLVRAGSHEVRVVVPDR